MMWVDDGPVVVGNRLKQTVSEALKTPVVLESRGPMSVAKTVSGQLQRLIL